MEDTEEINLEEERERFVKLHNCSPEEFLTEWDLQNGSHPCKEGYSDSKMAVAIFWAKLLETK